jgi:preprotein translocase subunit YajC
MWGKIIALDDKVATIEIADKVKIKMLRDRISGRWPSAQADKSGKAEKLEKSDSKAAEAAR